MFNRFFSQVFSAVKPSRLVAKVKNISPYKILATGVAGKLVYDQARDYVKKDVKLTLSRHGRKIWLNDEGIVLMLEYFGNKKQQQNLFLVKNGQDLQNTLALFVKSETDNLILLFYSGWHWSVIKCEKYQNKNYFIVIDSIPDHVLKDPFYSIRNSLALPDSSWVLNFNKQQGADFICLFYALKNIAKAAATPRLMEEIMTQHHVMAKEEDAHLGSIIRYRLPARFMSITASPDQLERYVRENYSEAIKVVRLDKSGKQEDMKAYALHSRDRFGVKTPVQVKNRYYQKGGSEPKFVFKNKTTEYFQQKYCNQVVPTMFNSLGRFDLQRKLALDDVVYRHNVKNLALDPQSNRLMLTSVGWCQVTP